MFNKMLGVFIVIGTFLLSGCTIENTKQGDTIDLQIEPSKIPSALRVGETFDVNFSYLDNGDFAEKVEISTSTPDIISLTNLKVTALKQGLATIDIKYPTTIDSSNNTRIDYSESSTQIYVYDSRVPADFIREESKFNESLRGTVMENASKLKFGSYRLYNDSKILSLSGSGEIIFFKVADDNYIFMTMGEIIDKNPAYSQENFFIKEIQFEQPDLLYLKGFNKTHSEIVEEKNPTDSGVRNKIIDNIEYDCGTEEEVIIDLEGSIKDTRTINNEICERPAYLESEINPYVSNY